MFDSRVRLKAIDEQVSEVAGALGIQVTRLVSNSRHGFDYEIRITALPAPRGFGIWLADDYMSWTTELELDEFSAPLLNAMRLNYPGRYASFESYRSMAIARNVKHQISINGKAPSPSSGDELWSDFKVSLTQSYSTLDAQWDGLFTVLLDTFCLILCLVLDDEEWVDEVDGPTLGAPEGDRYLSTITKYERSRYNRALCLKFHGFRCQGCGLLMEDLYGPLGKGVIHVHHVVPLSLMSESRVLDPISDLRPLCPNCHNVIHAQWPPMPLEELNTLRNYVPSRS